MSSSGRDLTGRKILVCVSASIASYKAVYLVRSLVGLGAHVCVAQTPSSKRFVGAETFSAVASEPTYDDLWDNRGSIAHTTLGRSVDAVIVVPATASTIAKMAHGIADDIVSATLVCTPRDTPVFVAPAMHEEMFDHPSTTANLATLNDRGVHIIGPVTGELAGGDTGRGRLVDTDIIVDQVISELAQRPLRDLTQSMTDNNVTMLSSRPVVLITAGGTREPIDPVRVITNRSTGKMGHALAHAAHASGYRVILITASALASDNDIERIDVETASQMHEAVMKYLDQADIVIMTAAVADVTPKNPSSEKLKRSEGITSIDVVPTVDIVKEIVEHKKPETYIVCFAAETKDLLAHARTKFESKHVDMLIANDVTRLDSGFGSETNKVWIFTSKEEPHELATAPKEAIAYQLIDIIDQSRAARG